MINSDVGKKLPVVLATCSLFLAVASPEFANAERSSNASKNSANEQQMRGKYLVTITGCNDCHTPFVMGPNGPEPDMTRMLSGHPQTMELPPAPGLPAGPWVVVVTDTNTAWSGPWGLSYTANLTPDKETGLGKWTQREFIDTIRTGRHLGRGRPILPPMPYPMYKHLTDEDLSAIFAFLQSLPPIRNKVPEPIFADDGAPQIAQELELTAH